MTDITKSDEVWVSCSKNGDYVQATPCDDWVSFTRTDLAQAAVAAAYEAAASHAKYTRVAIVEATAKAIVANLVSVTQTRTANAIEDAIRALATQPEADALAAALATAREDGMREAIAIASARSHERKSFHSPFSVPISEAVNAIEAAIQKGAAT